MPYTIKDASGSTLYMDGAGTGADSGNAITPNSTILGAINETAPATDTASAGLNGRLQRVAQRLSSLIALVPTALTGSGNFRVAVQESVAVPVTDNGGSLTVDGTITANQGGTWNIGTIASALPAGEAHIGEVGGRLLRVSAEFTRPADTTAYTAGDVVSDSTSASTLITLSNAVRVNAGSGYIVRASLTTDRKSITPRFRVHLFNATGATVSADNAAYREVYADASRRLGYFDLPAMLTPADTANSDMSRSLDNSIRFPFVAAAGTTSLFALLETLDAFTPASGQKFLLTLVVDCN